MRRTVLTLSTALMLLAFGPASALARHHHRRDHSRARHARIERFGRDLTGTPTTSSSADNAGTVQSFSAGKLTILLADGSMVSGMVTNDIELECTAPEQSQTIHEDGDGGSGDQSGGGDQSGSGDNQAQGSDDQSAGEDQGDAAEQNENDAAEQNEDQNDNDAAEQNENEAEDCSTADLSHGTVVREAELRISGAGSVWKKVELGS